MITSSARQLDLSGTDSVFAVAAQLAPARVLSVNELQKGGNSRIYKVTTENGAYALKSYPQPSAHDPRDRLKAETEALSFMQRHGFSNIPVMVASDAAQAYGLLSWCEGEAISEISDTDIKAFADFLVALGKASPDGENMPPASEACTDGKAILAHIEKRAEKLKAPAAAHEGLAHFLSEEFFPALQQTENRARKTYTEQGLSFDHPLPRAQQVLIPSDFGSHNALRGPDGLVFLDFEYFGWDDPVTSTANFILHPAMTLREEQTRLFLDRMADYFAARDKHYATRLHALLPLYAARWATIILGEFIPQHWEHRLKSGRYKPEEKTAVQEKQLAKARAALKAGQRYSK